MSEKIRSFIMWLVGMAPLFINVEATILYVIFPSLIVTGGILLCANVRVAGGILALIGAGVLFILWIVWPAYVQIHEIILFSAGAAGGVMGLAAGSDL